MAFACFERAIEVLQDRGDAEGARDAIARVRINQASALTRLGKLALAEQELRTTLRSGEELDPVVEGRAMLALANVHAEQGDLIMAELEAERAVVLARDAGDATLAARALHALGFVLAGRGRHAEAIERYRGAAAEYEELEESVEAARIRVNVGQCYVSLGKYREGLRLLRSALDDCRTLGHRRLEARCWSSMAEAHFELGDDERARRCLRASNTVLGSGNTEHADLLFVNAWYDWRIGRRQDNPTREKIAFGRLKALRSLLEKRFPEVDAFDEFVERGRNHA
jgi:tetratricopeptide (TPR) repeat protein